MDDLVYLCSPETAAASALTGVITEPRTLDMEYPADDLKQLKVNQRIELKGLRHSIQNTITS